MSQSASFCLEPFGTPREQRKNDSGTNPPVTLQLGETLRSTTSHSSLELKLWMKLCLNYHAGYKLEYPRQGQKPVLMETETVAAESVSNHLPVPRSRSASIHCSSAGFFIYCRQISFQEILYAFSLSNGVVPHFQTLAVVFEQ